MEDVSNTNNFTDPGVPRHGVRLGIGQTGVRHALGQVDDVDIPAQ